MIWYCRYHPFYITTSREGGYGQKSPEERAKQSVYAGVEYDPDGYPYPTAAGRYCEWTHRSIDKSSESDTFEDFMETLRLECDQGKPAYLNWTVPMDAPDILYYQVNDLTVIFFPLQKQTIKPVS